MRHVPVVAAAAAVERHVPVAPRPHETIAIAGVGIRARGPSQR
eukprot:COSAG01_NODE_19536_length_1004_cov_1.928177_1_plen_42_part_10